MTAYNRLLADWHELESSLKQRWKKLTDEDLQSLRSGVESFAQALAARYEMERAQAADELDEFFSTFRSTVRGKARDIGDKAKASWLSGKHRVKDAMDVGRRQAADAWESGRHRMGNARHDVEHTIGSHPLTSIGAALGAGVLIGMLLRKRS